MDENVLARFWAKVNKNGVVVRDELGPCWCWTASVGDHGYGQLNITRKPRLAHRLSWEIARGPIPQDTCVLHRCDNRRCVNPDHLFLGTRADNVADMISKGRKRTLTRRGAAHHMAKLTEDDVRAIRRDYTFGTARVKSETSATGLARRYGVSKKAILLILHRVNWPHLE